MKRVKLLPLLMLLASGGAFAQSTTSVTVGLSQAGPLFFVDGQQYNTTQTFLWPANSTHIIQFPFSVVLGQTQNYQSALFDTARWQFSSWTDNLGVLSSVANSPVLYITATPGLTSVIGSVSELMQLSIIFPPGTGSGGTNPQCIEPTTGPFNTIGGWGLIYIANTCYSDSALVFVPAGTQTMAAFPFPGFGFLGFEVEGNLPSTSLTNFNLTVPGTAIQAIFEPAKRVSFRTNPLALQVTVDSLTISTPPSPPLTPQQSSNINTSCTPDYAALPVGVPTGLTPLCIGDFDFLPTSKHTVGAPPSQQDNKGAWWVFSNFSDTAGQTLTQNGVYLTDGQTNYPDLVTANFIPGMPSAILTNPSGLKVAVDGTTAWPNYNFIWGQGTTHTISAAATQVDSSGRTWQFVGWSNGGSAAQTITVPTSGSGFAVTATYSLLGQVQVTSSPAGLTFTVGGKTCTTPCVVNQTSGTQLNVSIPASVPLSAGSRLDFSSWTGGATSASTTLQVTLTQSSSVFTANYYMSYLLFTATNPVNGATFKTSPASPDGYFPSGTPITVTPVPNSGYKFVGWGGDLSGTFTPGYLTMNGPESVVANLQAVPSIAPAGIVNAAGATPDGSVAPGSIISIYGQNLAGALQVGPSNPLAQTIGNVTVTVNGTLMPLMFVSPGQINALVPAELAPGSYTLTVNWVGQAPISGTFTVSRDAPGIFVETNSQNVSIAAALHQDGTLITAASPARRNEIVSLYGTGFGPHSQQIPDGFPAPLNQLDPVTDSVAISASSVAVPTTWAGAAPGMVGADIVQFAIVPALPSATNLSVVVTVGGKPSAVVQLPVQ
jgi:uncharacterized protein (TIGR03437 family)